MFWLGRNWKVSLLQNRHTDRGTSVSIIYCSCLCAPRCTRWGSTMILHCFLHKSYFSYMFSDCKWCFQSLFLMLHFPHTFDRYPLRRYCKGLPWWVRVSRFVMWGLIFRCGPQTSLKAAKHVMKLYHVYIIQTTQNVSISFNFDDIITYRADNLIFLHLFLWSMKARHPWPTACARRCICSWPMCSKSLQRSIAFAPWKRMEQYHEQHKKRGEDGWEELRGEEDHEDMRINCSLLRVLLPSRLVKGFPAQHLAVPAEVLTWGEPQCGGDSRAVRGQLHDTEIRKERKWWLERSYPSHLPFKGPPSGPKGPLLVLHLRIPWEISRFASSAVYSNSQIEGSRDARGSQFITRYSLPEMLGSKLPN